MKKLTKQNIITVIAIAILLAFAYLLIRVRPNTQRNIAVLADPDVLWRGDAETGDLSQWCRVNQAASGRISVVTSPVVQDRYAYKFILNSGDRVFNTERVTLSQQCDGRYELEGQEKFFRVSVLLLSNYPADLDSWSLFAQWKGIHTGSPPISLNLRNDRWMLNYRPTVNTGELHKWDTPVTKGEWATFILHVKWSADPKVGFIELWYNGVLVVPKFYTSTMHTNGTLPINNYFVIGLYREPINMDVILYHDGVIVCKTLECAMGEQPPVVTSVPSPTRTPTPVVSRTPTATRTATRTQLPPTVTFTPISITPTVTLTKTATPITTPTFECLLFPAHNQRVCLP